MTTDHRLAQDTRMHWLDKALAGQPTEVKARVLEIILKYDIDPENEFFMIFVAIGQLITLTETVPDDWQILFRSFTQDLEGWTIQTLQTMEQKARITKDMASMLRQQNTIFSEFISILSKQTDIWHSGVLKSASLGSKLETLRSGWDLRLDEIEHKHNKIIALLMESRAAIAAPGQMKWSVNISSLLIGMLAGCGLCFLLLRATPSVTSESTPVLPSAGILTQDSGP
ncbi:hypothetical protein Pse7367_3779 (plasmid) [Thalassoporum mexicanum PCC 7367]|uniref:DUF6753 family protein n=1 Tax=Thalassoporum mexicanum TaxID=3457544 RepID=UPI00029FADC0|nr:DUF6753 family protein [Pseudanabaena sp. PCC 7367]AFY72003.1 hypothetical protein Pse7367_3779 [Pseudanabaena sp. PCC 7367]